MAAGRGLLIAVAESRDAPTRPGHLAGAPGGSGGSRWYGHAAALGHGDDDGDDDRDHHHRPGDHHGGRHRRAPGPRGVVVAALDERPEPSGARARILLKLRHVDDFSWSAATPMSDSVQLQGIGASASARSTSRERTITLLVLTTKDSARMRSMTSSKCLTSVALM